MLDSWKQYGFLCLVAEPKEFVYVLDNCPHDWLFPRCMAVVKYFKCYLFLNFATLWNKAVVVGLHLEIVTFPSIYGYIKRRNLMI